MRITDQITPSLDRELLDHIERKKEEHDRSDMYAVLCNFPNQISEARAAVQKALFPKFQQNLPFTIVIGGMGGSAIGGKVFQDYAQTIPELQRWIISVHQSYNAPKWLSESLPIVIAISYSGNTEETLNFLDAAAPSASAVLCITSGGKLAEKAREHHYSLIQIPAGYQPRCAFGHLFFALLYSMCELGICSPQTSKEIENAITETHGILQQLRTEFSAVKATNPTIQLATALQNKIPLLYSSSDLFPSVNYRWRAQIQENAKQLAFGNFLPEMNHNEINGWEIPAEMLNAFVPIFLTDSAEDARIKKRIAFTETYLRERTGSAIELTGIGKTFLARLISLIYFGDWVSYWLALLNDRDPTPVPIIQKLKHYLQQDQ